MYSYNTYHILFLCIFILYAKTELVIERTPCKNNLLANNEYYWQKSIPICSAVKWAALQTLLAPSEPVLIGYQLNPLEIVGELDETDSSHNTIKLVFPLFDNNMNLFNELYNLGAVYPDRSGEWPIFASDFKTILVTPLADTTGSLNLYCPTHTQANLNCSLFPSMTSYNTFYCNQLVYSDYYFDAVRNAYELDNPNSYYENSAVSAIVNCPSTSYTGTVCISSSVWTAMDLYTGQTQKNKQLYYGGYCGCRTDADCPNSGQICNTATSLCKCRPGVLADCPLGVCNSITFICAPKTIADCNYRGNPDPNNPARCLCWDSSPDPLQATVFGPHCEIDLGRNFICHGHGTPVCPPIIAQHDPTLDFRSLSTGEVIGSFCNSSQSFIVQRKIQCLCDYNWTPDAGGSLTAGIPNSLCSQEGSCFGQSSAIFMGTMFGCQCITNTYPYDNYPSVPVDATLNPFGSLCVGNCSADRCSSQGLCGFDNSVLSGCNLDNCAIPIPTRCTTYCTIPTVRLKADGTLIIPYMNTCNCLSGWQSISTFHYTTDQFTNQIYCQVPYNSNVNGAAPCGYGIWTPITTFAGYCKCGSFINSLARDSSNNQISVTIDNYYLTNSRGLCVPTCPTLNAQTYDPMMVNGDNPPTGPTVGISFNNLICGGDRRGLCVSDGNEGMKCQCKNGYMGIACETVLCPLAFGMICGGNGVCDPQTNTCICNNSEFVGQACEIREAACSLSQPVKSNPTTSTLNIPNDLTPLTQL